MNVYFKSKKLGKQLTVPVQMQKAYGQMARKVDQRLEELKAANTLADMRMIPGARYHELSGQREGQLAVNISGNFRLIFIPEHEPIPEKDDGGLDWDAVIDIKIIEVVDYHGE